MERTVVDELPAVEGQPASESAPSARSQRQIPGRVALEMERSYLRVLIGPEFRPIFGMVALTLSVGTAFYALVEKWSVLDALYFCVVTLATIGFGDLTPTTRIGKIFTIGYVFVGVGTLGLFLSTVARSSIQQSQTRAEVGASNSDDDAQ